ncbi:hypothetical protein BJX64DRAFT_254741 [Aspergillus heterothallicus]
MYTTDKLINDKRAPCVPGNEKTRNRVMESTKLVGVDGDQYCKDVLLLPSKEQENTREQQLVEEAKRLGLKVPDVELVASLATSIASGIVDLSSPILSSSSSTDRISVCDVSPVQDSAPLDQLASSLSEYTLSSSHPKGGSTRSIASLSTRPTSYSSSEGKLAQGTDAIATSSTGHRSSLLNVINGGDKKEKERRRSGIKSAIGKIQFRKKRTPSTVLLPAAVQITVTRGETGAEKLYVESKPSNPRQSIAPDDGEEVLKLEVPVFDNEALLRSLTDSQLKQMREKQIMERDRHISFQRSLVSELRLLQQTKVEEQLAQNRRIENEKREKNLTDASRMEERQLVVEMEQLREFERAKMNSRTRIKYMEGYLSSSSPPSSRSPSISGSDLTTPGRSFTQQQKAQLAQEYHDYDAMDQLHESKIKVLRDRQEIRLQEAMARMGRELETLIDKHANEASDLRTTHQQEEAAVLQSLNVKKMQLRHRWVLEEAILRKKLEDQHDKPFGPLPPLSFSDMQSETRDSAICVTDTDQDTETLRQEP